ncbi:MAG: proline dehydrogenase family protein [Deltaproteobacteria bacterium]|nr:proline dehydrogenase family protein [Deltaproteobacteria bacterium]
MLKRVLNYFAKRYIAGDTREDAVEAVRALNGQNVLGIIDHLGENVTKKEDADKSVAEYVSLLRAIEKSGVKSTVSLKLTHLGLDIGDSLAMENLELILSKAGTNFVRIDMESSVYTGRTIEIFLKLCERHPNLGIAVQAYLKQSEHDIDILIKHNSSVRLVKGAYKEPLDIAFADKTDTDKNFLKLMKKLLKAKGRTAIATHDEKIITEAIRFCEEESIPKDTFDFEMLLGIKRKLQKELASRGFSVRVYVPYGTEWLPYMLRRLTERKENLWFVLKNIVG